MTFTLNGEEIKGLEKFKKERIKKHPTLPTTIGGRFTISFTPTAIGNIVEVTDIQGDVTKEITDVSMW